MYSENSLSIAYVFSSFTLIKYNCYTCMSTELCTVCKMGEGDHNHERIERSFSHFPIILSKNEFLLLPLQMQIEQRRTLLQTTKIEGKKGVLHTYCRAL